MDSFWKAVAETARSRAGIDLGDAEARPVAGGCINESFLLVSRTDPERRLFVKRNAADKLDRFEAEKAALDAIRATGTIRAPAPLASGTELGSAFLILEAIPLRPAAGPKESREMGRQLARMHRITEPEGRFGWHRGNFIGETPQPNPWTGAWPEFFARHRLGHQFDLAAAAGKGFRGARRLIERVPEFFSDYQPASSLLHGDLWSGNAGFDGRDGEPVVFDPAGYFGDRETDLAFTALFGGFGPAFYEGYAGEWPFDPGFADRKELYNLYHVLNHHHLFGGGYAAQAQGMIDRLLARH